MNNSLIPGDVDIDFANRDQALALLTHIPAAIIRDQQIEKHKTGVYFHAVPIDPISQFASLDYQLAANQGWYKVDLLNVSVYQQIRDEQHLLNLMAQPIDWRLFEHEEFTCNLIHIGNHTKLVSKLKPKNIGNLAIILALIRPGKKYLIEKCENYGFESVKDEIWTASDAYSFRKSHATSYAMLVKVHAALLIEQANGA